MDMIKNGWIPLSQYIFIFIVSTISSLIICFALWMIRYLTKKNNFECAPSLLGVYLFSLLFSSFCLSIQYFLLLAFTFFFKTTTKIIFWTGLFPGSLLPAAPVSVLFLSLDRLLIVLTPHIYFKKAPKFILALANCISFGCLTSDASRLIYAINRLVVALPNFISGNLLPNTINFLLTAFFDINISVYVGAFRSLTFCLNSLFASSTHTKILWHIFSSSKIIPSSKTINGRPTILQQNNLFIKSSSNNNNLPGIINPEILNN
uniref:Serpentine receptor class gamma n=1 Tax=Meloidogyne floridensis TaxID=298350 RepID=A0A915PFI1_9BILA